MVKRAIKKYQKEYEALIEKYAGLLHRHTSSVFCRFLNDLAKLQEDLGFSYNKDIAQDNKINKGENAGKVA